MSMPIVSSSSVVLKKMAALRGFHTTSARQWWSYPGWWFEDHKTRRWPVSEEQRKAAAARYGLREGDYKPYKEDYQGGIGDYPNLGDINYAVKDPYENYSYDKYRRNFMEAVPWNHDIYSFDRYSYTNTEKIKGWRIVAEYIILYGGLFLFMFCIFEFPIRRIVPMKAKQYPYDYNYAYLTADHKLYPLTHYTFEEGDGKEPAEVSISQKDKKKQQQGKEEHH